MPSAERQTPRERVPADALSVRRARGLQAQRERALQAAVEVVAEYGYSSAFVARVTGHAGISRLTFHQLFDSGEGCFLAAFDHGVAQIAAEVTPAYLAGGSWRARVRAGLSALLLSLDREPGFGSLVIVDALTVGPRVLERRTQILDTLIAAVDGGGDQTTSPLTAEGVVGAVFSVIHTCLSGQYSDPLIELSNPLTAMIVLPYLGHAAASRELARPTPKARRPTPRPKPAPEPATPRLGHRGPIILQVIATTPGLSNGAIAERVGLRDTGHISRLLLRLSDQGLIVNKSRGHPRGIKAWRVTEAGERAWREGLRPADGDSPILHR